MKLFTLRINAHTALALQPFKDTQIETLLVGSVLDQKVRLDCKSTHDAYRSIVVRSEEWDTARLALPRGYTMGDVADRLCQAPLRDPVATTITVATDPYTRQRMKELWRRKQISADRILLEASEGSDPDIMQTDEILLQTAFSCRHGTKEAFLSRDWHPAQQAAAIARAVESFRDTPARELATDWGRVTLQRRTADLLRGLTWSLRKSKDEVLALGAELVNDPQPVEGRRVQVRINWKPETIKAVTRFRRPSDAVEAIVAVLAKDRIPAVDMAARMHKQCFPRGA